MTVIVVDVGATETEAGFGGWQGRSDPVYTEETPDSRSSFVRMLRNLIDELTEVAEAEGRGVSGASIGVPGWVDQDGRLAEAPHTSFGEIDIETEVSDATEAPVVVENDANAQALGCAEPSETVCYVALGTGVGGATVVSGDLLKGANGFAGEVGHIPVSYSDSPSPCPCGKDGCLDTVAGGKFLREELGDSWWERELSSEERGVITEAGKAAGEVATTLATLNDPTRVVLAGHLTEREGFIKGVTETWNHPWTDCIIETYKETWPFSRAGLTELALDTEGSRLH